MTLSVLSHILTLLLLSSLSALIGFGFNRMQDHDMIFNWYPDYLRSLIYRKSKNILFDIETQAMNDSTKVFVAHECIFSKFWYYITKPLGLCIVCNTAWIGIIITLIVASKYSWILIFDCIAVAVASAGIVVFLINKYKQIQKSI